MGIAFGLHILFAVLWVGGMFFAYACLRPAAGALDAATRTQLWAATLSRFFPVVLLAIPVMLGSGFYMVSVEGGLADAGLRIHLMLGIGVLMMLLFLHVFFAPFQKLKRAVAANNTAQAVKSIAQIRQLVAINLTLGLIVVLIASGGKYLIG
jgi:uncharacterized membrane protein